MRLTNSIAVLVLVGAACSTTGGTSEAVFEPFAGLECPTDYYWGEYGSLSHDAEGLPTIAAAVEAGLVRWQNEIDGHTVMDEGTSGFVGALVVGGRRVVQVQPELAPAGGWLVITTVTCEGYER